MLPLVLSCSRSITSASSFPLLPKVLRTACKSWSAAIFTNSSLLFEMAVCCFGKVNKSFYAQTRQRPKGACLESHSFLCQAEFLRCGGWAVMQRQTNYRLEAEQLQMKLNTFWSSGTSSPCTPSIAHFNYNLWVISLGRQKERQHNTDFVLCSLSQYGGWFPGENFKVLIRMHFINAAKIGIITSGSQHGSPATWQIKHIQFFEETTSFGWQK